MGTEPEDDAIEAVEVRRSAPAYIFLLSPAVMLAAIAMVAHPPASRITGLVSLLWFAAAAWSWIESPWAHRHRVRLSLKGGALRVEDVETGAAREVSRRGLVVRRPSPLRPAVTAILLRRGLRLSHFELMREHHAHTLLSGLGVSAETTFETASLLSRSFLYMWTPIIVMAVGLASFAGSDAAILGGGATLLAVSGLLAVPSVISVGSDGVGVRWLSYRRFISYHQLREARAVVAGLPMPYRTAVELVLHSGERVRLPIHGQTHPLLSALARALAADGATPPAPLRRDERSFSEWVAALRRAEAADLRSPATSRDDLWAVIERAAATPLERAAAVVALGPTSEPDRARLARIADRVVHPTLRLVIDTSDVSGDEALAAQLESLEREERRR